MIVSGIFVRDWHVKDCWECIYSWGADENYFSSFIVSCRDLFLHRHSLQGEAEGWEIDSVIDRQRDREKEREGERGRERRVHKVGNLASKLYLTLWTNTPFFLSLLCLCLLLSSLSLSTQYNLVSYTPSIYIRNSIYDIFYHNSHFLTLTFFTISLLCVSGSTCAGCLCIAP